MTDLPTGYRWANEYETEEMVYSGEWGDAIVVYRDHDANGIPYHEGESDLAFPLLPAGPVEREYADDYDYAYDEYGVVSPYSDRWESGYLAGSGENMYDDSYIDYLNNDRF